MVDRNVSVIIPVYNAASFVEKAVESALNQVETKEVILIEDGSTDDSLQICEKMESKYENVKLYTHYRNSNQGAGASRNVGIKKATGEYVAFLDADDYYLPERFRAERIIFAEKPETDGVYGALGFHFYYKEGEEKFSSLGLKDLTTVTGKIAPSELFAVLMGLHESQRGHFSIDTLTIKRVVFEKKAELFSNLQLHEDTVFFIQLAINCQLEPGIINEPIGMRGVHENNRIGNLLQKSDSRIIMWSYLYTWSNKKLKCKNAASLFKLFLMKEKVLFSNRIKSFFLFLYYSGSCKVFLNERMFFNRSCLYVFGKYYGNYIIVLKERIIKKTDGAAFSW